MKQRMNRKAIISLIVAIVAIICIVTTVAICHLVRENKLEDIQNEILAELERNEGKYDERSIVLDSTSKARAEELAALLEYYYNPSRDIRNKVYLGINWIGSMQCSTASKFYLKL